MDAKETLQREIDALEKQIEARKQALKALMLGEAKSGDGSLRFYLWRPLDAMRTILQENGQKMKRDQLTLALQDGGITIDRKRKGHNVRISIDKNIALGNIVELENDYIDLPERAPVSKKTKK
jgi:hypothetical protein